jgi:hypothetical protein
VRLVRLGQQPSRVAEDIRAALASLGRGSNVVGGLALIGPRPLPTAKPVDAIMILPRGVIVVVGVDLPDPAMRLEAPLSGPWKADGWPLVSPDKAINPAAGALTLAASIGRTVQEKAPGLPVGTIVAVGPYVETVDQPAADVAGPTRVLHPTPTSMLAAAVSLTSAKTSCTADDVRALLKLLAPDAPRLDSEALAGEGFASEGFTAEPAAEDRLSAITVKLTQVPPPAPKKPPARLPAPAIPPLVPPPKPIEVTTPVPRINIPLPPPEQASRTVRWLPVAAIALLAVMLVTAIVLATTGGGGENAAPPPPRPSPTPVSQAVQGFQFLKRDLATDANCAAHAYGDVQASLQRAACTMMRRGSFESSADGHAVAVSIAVLYFNDEATASAFKNTADTAGGGGLGDLASETGKWPRTPQFAGAAYASSVTSTAVRLVLATWLDGASSAGDPALNQVGHAALNVQLA